jgi:type IV secretion system protein VirB6
VNPAICQRAMEEVGSGIAASLAGVDCVALGTTQAAFGRLFGTGGALIPALTILLTLYVGFFAFQLLTGRSSVGVNALTPRMMTIGLVLTFATSWIAYSQVVWNLALGAPNEIASILTGTRGSATMVFAQKVDILLAAIGEASGMGPRSETPGSIVSPEGMLWMGATMLLLGTAGVLVTTRIAMAVLIAIGPVFVVLALFPGTRGLFTGWLKGLMLLAIAPVFAVLGGSLMLELAVPVVRQLAPVPGAIDPRAAMAFFLIGAVHVALMAMVMKVAATMVAGWSVFGLAASAEERKSGGTSSRAAAAAAPAAAQAQQQTAGSSRHINLSGVSTAYAANDGGSSGSHSRETVIRTVGERAAASGAGASALSRARGIGSRFRAAPVRFTEKIR